LGGYFGASVFVPPLHTGLRPRGSHGLNLARIEPTATPFVSSEVAVPIASGECATFEIAETALWTGRSAKPRSFPDYASREFLRSRDYPNQPWGWIRVCSNSAERFLDIQHSLF